MLCISSQRIVSHPANNAPPSTARLYIIVLFTHLIHEQGFNSPDQITHTAPCMLLFGYRSSSEGSKRSYGAYIIIIILRIFYAKK